MTQVHPLFASMGIDIGKDLFHIVGFSPDGKISLRKKVKRLAVEQEFAKLPPSRYGSVFERPFHESNVAPPRSHAKDYSRDLREAIFEGAEERLQ